MAKYSAASALTLTTLLLAVTSCVADNSYMELPESILVQILGSKYTTFVKLLGNSGLLSDLESDERFNAGVTIFATTDEYFAYKVSPSVLQFLEQPQNFPLLRKVLLNHILPGKFGAGSWYPGETVTSLSGSEAHLHLDAGDMKVNDAVIKEFGVLDSADGVVHALEGFLVPEEVEESAQENARTTVVVEEERRDMMQKTFVVAQAMAPVPPMMPPVMIPSPLPSPMAPAPAPSSPITSLGDLLDRLAEFDGFRSLIQSNQAFADFLAALLENGTPITILAPSNEAVSAASLTGYDAFIVLQNHVIKGVFSYDMLIDMAPSPTARRLLQDGPVSSYANNTMDLTKTADGTLLVNGVVVSRGVIDESNVSAVEVQQVIVPENAKLSVSAPPPPQGSGAKFGVSVLSVLASLAIGSVLVF